MSFWWVVATPACLYIGDPTDALSVLLTMAVEDPRLPARGYRPRRLQIAAMWE